MPTIHFEGASDDIVTVAGPCYYKGKVHTDGEEWSAYAEHLLAKRIVLVDGEGVILLRVYAIYDGCWTFAVGMVDEDVLLPDWPIRVLPGAENAAYSIALEIDVPDGVYAITVEDWEEREAQRRRLAESYGANI